MDFEARLKEMPDESLLHRLIVRVRHKMIGDTSLRTEENKQGLYRLQEALYWLDRHERNIALMNAVREMPRK